MSYGTILLHLGDTPGLDARIDAAIHLARRQESHLVGLAATGNARFEASLGASLLPREELRDALAAARRRAGDRARRFAERALHSTLGSHEFAVDDRDDADAIVQRGLYADLAVIGVPGSDDDGSFWHRAEFERTLVEAAPPVLVLPAALPGGAEMGRRVLVAWKPERACARAITAALPLLRRAQQVHLVHVDTPFEDVVAVRPTDELQRARERLCRDGVAADASSLRSSLDPGSALLEEIGRCGADLLVMGAWGRPPWSERVFGGCTRTLMARLPVPALVAH